MSKSTSTIAGLIEPMGAVARAALLISLWFFALGCNVASAQSEPAADSDADRLRGLLLRYQSADETKASEKALDEETWPSDPLPSESELAAALNAPYSVEKVLLRADELPQLLAAVESRLSNQSIADRRNDASLIGTIQIRQRGTLVGSSTYSLKHIGKHQFLGQTELGQGRNILGVADSQWEVELPATKSPERYLLVLIAPPRQDWELHLVPASSATALGNDVPQWLREPSTEASAEP
ncbi:hypothetical protein [Congregibacter sp.]|uniref:hypothetical protein n=1 Tax=Congregibacter sp. TaxID=2744308 RepID=UPI003F6A987B